MPNENNIRSLADILSRPMTEQEEAWGRLFEASVASAYRTTNWITPGGRNLASNHEQRIIVDPFENRRSRYENLTYLGASISIDTVGIAQGDTFEITGQTPVPPSGGFLNRAQNGPWRVERPTSSLQYMYMRFNAPMFVDSLRGLDGHSGEMIDRPVTPPKPDYEVVNDTVLAELLVEHVKPWFDGQTKKELNLRMDKLEKVNVKNGKRYRLKIGYQYTNYDYPGGGHNKEHWYSILFSITDTGEVTRWTKQQ